MKDPKDKAIQDEFAKTLKKALKQRRKTAEQAAKLLNVEPGTMYKYLAGDIIPGGQVLWLACFHLGMILDETGLRVGYRRNRLPSRSLEDDPQYELPFINESVTGDKIQAKVRKKDSQYVQVSLRIKIAG
jgi:transcriptional regulator with XRE-family HTH domain